ncbi:nucleotide exchange factor GrpE [Patescibacteria group bacterium]|nr:nucleotide exchange factor GrpE [Patescibacteria group bacterium]MBU1703633.1 nucleotide exchange factor GrpE [Patescibacteria group bacterium]MBU1954206.1 nucleotide exchange factor GrpE [Patescibacteria group bacterium]
MDDTQDKNIDLDNLQKELEQTKQKLDEMTAISQRALADLQNFKRRNEEEKAVFIAFANAALFTELLPSIENIHRTLDHETKDEEWIKGAEQTMKQILQICEKAGLNEIPAKIGDSFDPNIHEALLTAPGPKDQILEVLEKGYTLENRVIKPARVKVGNGEPETHASP